MKYLKVLGFTGLVLSIALVSMSFWYIQKTSEAHDVRNENIYTYRTDNPYVAQTLIGRYSNEIGTLSAVHFTFYMLLSAYALWKFGRKKFLFSGVICSTGMLVWTYYLITQPLAITFDEVGPVWIAMAVLQMGVAIAVLKQALTFRAQPVTSAI